MSYLAIVVSNTSVTPNFGAVSKTNLQGLNNAEPDGGIVAFSMNDTQLANYLNPSVTIRYAYLEGSCKDPVKICNPPPLTAFPSSLILCLAILNYNSYTVDVSIDLIFANPVTVTTTVFTTSTESVIVTDCG
ncbi:5952_t:CDS:2 [Acaulospora morrowiae]|uniref:5952_t:CDS:1 n=1 Tax=Acaulospora morrowiae TaxID=94023 RepID=A0A9N8Z2F8_9GLOM|nr:5952_t:CDS:2 [Acaulospora morrowiae]